MPENGGMAWGGGRGKAGLTNAERDRCQRVIHGPGKPEYSSVNLAMAVQGRAYELRQTLLAPGVETPSDVPPATQAAMDGLFEHLERALIHLRYLNPDNPRLLMRRLRRLFHRATPDSDEVNLLRGVLTKIERCTPPQRD